ncbi:MAG TPA: class I SAM-dependent methyltransferase [Polyangiaceae bacterium]|nr:class I SAM-dependent methyltransferase [Polyangiaceae bacterium]
MDPIVQFKEMQRATWSGFAILENLTGTAAPSLVKFAGVTKGAELLDVGCGTGVVGLTAARLGARVTGADLTPELIAHAKENAVLMKLEASFLEADVEALPFPDAKFDFVVSQVGHMFAPRPEVAIKEMLRVLKPGGVVAFTTWPPELFVGRSFALMGKYSPPPLPGVSPPAQWGDPNIVRERLGTAVRDLAFTRGRMTFPILSVGHYRAFMEKNFGPAQKLLGSLDASDPAKAAALRRDMEDLASQYFDDNTLAQDYLITRALKV